MVKPPNYKVFKVLKLKWICKAVRNILTLETPLETDLSWSRQSAKAPQSQGSTKKEAKFSLTLPSYSHPHCPRRERHQASDPPRIRRSPTKGKLATGDDTASANPTRSLKPRELPPTTETHKKELSFNPSNCMPFQEIQRGCRVFPQIPNSSDKVGSQYSQLPYVCPHSLH